jgi:hypothetical protein
MAIATKNVHNALVFYDDASTTERWFDAIGDGVVKYELNTAACPTDNTTGMPTEFTNTLVNASTFAHTDIAGGAVLITCANAENDGVSLQLGDELGGVGESVSFAGDYPCYFEITFQGNDVDQTDFLFGVCITDTALLGGMTDGIYFRSVDESAVLNFVLEKDSVESVTAAATLTDATDITASFYFDGVNIIAAINDVQVASIARTDASFPNDELLRLSVEVLRIPVRSKGFA